MDRRPDQPSAAWPAVLAILAVVAVAIGVQLSFKQRGLVIRDASSTGNCSPREELVCTDVEHIERMLRDQD